MKCQTSFSQLSWIKLSKQIPFKGACADGSDALIDNDWSTPPCADSSRPDMSKCVCSDGSLAWGGIGFGRQGDRNGEQHGDSSNYGDRFNGTRGDSYRGDRRTWNSNGGKWTESLIVYSKIGTFISFNFINSISK